MRKIVSILLVSLILLQTSSLSFDDVLKMKNLYEHAKFHQKMYGDSFMDFLAEHYGNKKDIHQNEHKEHQDLPLKHTGAFSHAISNFTVNICSQYNLDFNNTFKTKENFFYKEHSSSQSLNSVFQPPKLA